jgi:hypothetical protein
MISKPNNKVPNVHFIIYSNENTTDLVGLSLKYFERYIGLDNINITVVSNKFLTDNLPFKGKVNYISANIEFTGDGAHFGPTVKSGLDIVPDDYIFYFCEDYMLTSNVDVDALNRMIRLFDEKKIDMFSFSSFQPHTVNMVYEKEIFKPFEYSQQYGFEKDELYYTNNAHLHQYSVQPCIWRKSSLAEIIKYNPNLCLHHLDTSHIADKKGKYRNHDALKSPECYSEWPSKEDAFDFKTLCCKQMIFDYYPHANQKFIITYIEIIRFGKMTVPGALGHGSSLAEDNWVQQKIYQIIDENNLRSDPEFDKYFNQEPRYIK